PDVQPRPGAHTSSLKQVVAGAAWGKQESPLMGSCCCCLFLFISSGLGLGLPSLLAFVGLVTISAAVMAACLGFGTPVSLYPPHGRWASFADPPALLWLHPFAGARVRVTASDPNLPELCGEYFVLLCMLPCLSCLLTEEAVCWIDVGQLCERVQG
ncbi:unnamed protein product, partial [Discosporangium mesarthrocarpum]